jgi:DNA-binding NtrC family response regulator
MSERKDETRALDATELTRQDRHLVIDFPVERTRVEKLGDFVLRYVETVIEACGGNKARAARLLGVSRKTIYRRLGLSK